MVGRSTVGADDRDCPGCIEGSVVVGSWSGSLVAFRHEQSPDLRARTIEVVLLPMYTPTTRMDSGGIGTDPREAPIAR